jgi:hypothetical protein
MSTQSPETKDGPPVDMGQDYPDLSLAGDEDAVSSDEETIKGDTEQGPIAEVLEEDLGEDVSNAPPEQGSVASRYRQLLNDQADVSDDGSSTHGLPRRAGSPIDSLSSMPDDSPSVQVRASDSTVQQLSNLPTGVHDVFYR